MLVGADAGDRLGGRRRAPRCVLARPEERDDGPARPASWSPTTTRSCAAACGRCSTREPDLEVVAEAGTAPRRSSGARRGLDLAVLDVSMPRLTGLQAAARDHAARPRLRVLMLSMHDNEQYLFEALEAGASGYVLKSAADRDLVEACRAAMRGEPFLYPRGGPRARPRPPRARAARRGAPTDPLTPREQEVVKLIAEAHTNDEIAELLVISKKTVERHRANILEKLGMRDRVELTRYAIRRGLVEP